MEKTTQVPILKTYLDNFEKEIVRQNELNSQLYCKINNLCGQNPAVKDPQPEDKEPENHIQRLYYLLNKYTQANDSLSAMITKLNEAI